MRKSVIAVVLATLVATVGLGGAPHPASASSGPKVVIIVGANMARRPATGRTPTRHTPRPSSTRRTCTRSTARTRRGPGSRRSPRAPRSWSTSVTATGGRAHTVRHEIHGKDGFGLNATAGAGDYNNTYYGEPYVATLDLAPNAVILLTTSVTRRATPSLASRPEPVSVAHQRVDNYAAGFLKAERAPSSPTATGQPGPTSAALLTTHQRSSRPGARAELSRQRALVRLDEDARRDRLHGPDTATDRLTTARWRPPGPHDR